MATVPNYFIDGGAPVNPFQTGLAEGMRFGATIQDFQAAQQQRQQQQQQAALKLQQEQQAIAAQQAEQQRKLNIQQRLAAKRPQDYTRLDTIDLMSLYDKDTQTAAKSIFEQLPEEGRKQQVKTLGGIASAIRGGNVDAAKQLIQQQIEANKEVDPAEAQQYQTLMQTLEKNPDAVFPSMVQLLGVAGKEGQDALTSILGAEKTGVETRKLAAEAGIKETEAKFAEKTALAELEKKKWDIKNVQSQIARAAAQTQIDRQRLALDTQKAIMDATAKAGEIPEFAQKDINAAAVSAASSKQLATQTLSLAQQLEAAGGGYGAAAGAAEWLKKATGRQDALTDLRKEYVRLKNQGVIKALPPGVATDKDIELAAAGFLPETANAKTLASFLRGMSKMQTIEANVANAKVDWLAQNKGMLTKPKTTIVVGDYTAKPGESFSDLSVRIATETAKQFRSPAQLAEEQRQRSVAQIPTTGAAPAAQTPSVRARADAILGGAR